MRIGIGYDIHRFNSHAGPLTLGGVRIPSARALAGHSDADVLLHAVTDAVLGAIGAPDIGELFPPSDPAYRGKDSRWFVQRAVQMARTAGWAVNNLDATVVTDAPKLTAHKPAMRRAIAGLLGVASSAVSVKAKTTEGLPPGPRGMSAQVVVLLKPAARRQAR